jgi:NhaA family Na+:H+ antiporter
LAGIGFTMSLSIAAQAFPVPNDFAAVQIAMSAASVSSALRGVATLRKAQGQEAVPTFPA